MTIREVLDYYKKNFAKCWDAEKYKWVAVKHFQDKRNIDAEDFAGHGSFNLNSTCST